jgi:hypothetical protein
MQSLPLLPNSIVILQLVWLILRRRIDATNFQVSLSCELHSLPALPASLRDLEVRISIL